MASSSRPARAWPLALLAVLGAAFGFGLARTLFEWQPLRLAALGQWPGTLLLAGLCAALAAALGWRFPALRPAPALPLALPALHALAPDVDLLRGWVLLAGGLALTGLLLDRERAPARTGLHAVLLFLVLFSIYLSGLAPAVGEADTFEFQVGIARLGIAHGSGYPLLMLVGKVFALLPLGGTLAWRANLTSAFFGALAAVLGARLARRLGAGPLPALIAGFAFGLSPTLWSRAVEVEAYTLNAALVAALLLLAFDLAASASLRRLPLLAFIFGLSLTNHLTTLLLAPALAGAVFFGLRRVKAPEKEDEGSKRAQVRLLKHQPPSLHPFASALLCLLLGLSIYLYLPLRWPAVNHGERLSLAQFANILTGNEARGAFQWALPLRDPGRYAIVFDKLASEYGPAGLAVLAIGLALTLLVIARLRLKTLPAPSPMTNDQLPITPYHLPLLFIAFVPYLYFALAFNVPDPDFSAFFIPLHLITAVLLSLGVQWLIALTRPPARTAQTTDHQPFITHHPPPTAAACLLLTAFALLPLASLWRNLPRVDQSNDWASYRLGQHMLAQPLAPGAAILADSQKIAPLYYLQVAEGVRPDLDILVLPDEASYRAVLDERLAAGQVVYLGRYLPGLGGGYALRSVGPLVEVAPRGWDQAYLPLQPAPASPPVPGLRLLGYAGDTPGGLNGAPPDELPVTLAWQAETPLDAHLLVSLQLVAPDGLVAWRGPGRVPAGGLYPTNAWRPGEVVTDYHTVPLAPHLAPGTYWLQVGVFAPFAVSDEDWVELAPVTVNAAATAPRPPRPLRARFDAQWLLGYALPESVAPGAPVAVTLYWQRGGTESAWVTAFEEDRSLAAWPPGSMVPQVYALNAPTSADEMLLRVTKRGTLAHCGWLALPEVGCQLPPVRVAGQAAVPGARNFDHQLLLNAAVLETPTAAPGGQVRVTLEWQGLRRMSEDYTVFVHLLGPDGLVHGQVDAWPVSGTRATSTWEPGVRITDPYVVAVPADAPPGTYQVEIGVYLLATGQRLAVLNDTGEAVDDRVLVDGLTITPP